MTLTVLGFLVPAGLASGAVLERHDGQLIECPEGAELRLIKGEVRGSSSRKYRRVVQFCELNAQTVSTWVELETPPMSLKAATRTLVRSGGGAASKSDIQEACNMRHEMLAAFKKEKK